MKRFLSSPLFLLAILATLAVLAILFLPAPVAANVASLAPGIAFVQVGNVRRYKYTFGAAVRAGIVREILASAGTRFVSLWTVKRDGTVRGFNVSLAEHRKYVPAGTPEEQAKRREDMIARGHLAVYDRNSGGWRTVNESASVVKADGIVHVFARPEMQTPETYGFVLRKAGVPESAVSAS